jgi:hypothetical protein
VKPGDDPANFAWSCAIDVNGLVHKYWSRAGVPQRWFRLCKDAGPEVYTKPVDVGPNTPVTCLWCLSVENTL